MKFDYQQQKFRELRFEYYSAGRTLWFSDTMNIAGMLLGYAVELSLKQILITAGALSPRLRNSHQHLDLFLECVNVGAVQSDMASTDLLQYVSDVFNQRYPSQVTATIAKAKKRGQAVGLDLTFITGYDDLVIKLDETICSLYSDVSVSIGVAAAHFVNRPQGRSFFHSNIAALRNTSLYVNQIDQDYQDAADRMRSDGLTPETISFNLENHRKRLSTWRDAPASVWRDNRFQVALAPTFEEVEMRDFAKEFRYPSH